MAHISVHDTVLLAAEAAELEAIALVPHRLPELSLLCARLAALVEMDPDARVVLGGVGLVKGIATLLKPLCEKTSQSAEEHLCQAGEMLVRLLGLLLRADSNAAVLHVRGDAILLARLARTSAARGLRLAAITALQNMSAGECATAERSQTIGLLIEGLQLCAKAVAACLSTQDRAAGLEEAVWQARVTLSALSHSMTGRYMPLSDAKQMESEGAPAAASESVAAFVQVRRAPAAHRTPLVIGCHTPSSPAQKALFPNPLRSTSSVARCLVAWWTRRMQCCARGSRSQFRGTASNRALESGDRET